MKVLFFLQLGWGTLGNAIAARLSKKYNVHDFCGITYSFEAYDFLKKQKDVHYDPLVTEREIYQFCDKESVDPHYLKQIENEFGKPFLWPCILVDRTLMMDFRKVYHQSGSPYTHEQLLQILQGHFRWAIDFIDKVKPDCIVGSTVGCIAFLVLATVASKRGIPLYFIYPTRVLNRITISRSPYEDFDRIFKIYDKLCSGTYQSPYYSMAEEYIKKFRLTRLYYEGFKPIKPVNPIHAFMKLPLYIYKVLQYTYLFYSHRKRFPSSLWAINTMYKHPFWFHIDNTVRYTRKIFSRRWRKLEMPSNEEFVFFPLHYEPELSLSLFAPYYPNQLALIQHIAQCLPVGLKLYVKEHPAMVGLRPFSYYKKLKHIPNVQLISPFMDSHEIIKKSKLVITITGTAGWEAILLQKPVITFGEAFYNKKWEMAKRAGAIHQLPDLIHHALRHHQHNEKQLLYFVTAILEGSVEADLMRLWSLVEYADMFQDPHLDKIVDLLAEEMNLLKDGGPSQ